MKKTFYLAIALLMISTLSAQNKKLTLYYPDSTKIVNITGLDSMTIFICGASKVSYGGKDYNTVLIGNQCWLRESIDVGTMINVSSNQTNNSIVEKYCYNNDLDSCAKYGGLYQWNEAMQYVTTQGAKGICPTGWHIPTLSEFQILAAAVNNDGNSLKAIGQGTGGGAGTNTNGFSALLAGSRRSVPDFVSLGLYVFFWSTTEYNAVNAAYRFRLSYIDSNINMVYFYKDSGFSVRCIKD